MTTVAAPLATNPKPKIEAHPKCSGRDLLDHLADGCGPTKAALVQAIIDKKPAITGAELLEELLTTEIGEGTLQRAGLYVHGVTFSLNRAGPSATINELQQAREKVANLEGYIRDLEGKNNAQGVELATLRTDHARVLEDLDAVRVENAALKADRNDAGGKKAGK